MEKTNNSVDKPHIIMRPAVKETLRSIKPGETVVYDCRELTSYPSACGQVSKLNAAAGRTEWTIKSLDNGATYSISRAKL